MTWGTVTLSPHLEMRKQPGTLLSARRRSSRSAGQGALDVLEATALSTTFWSQGL